MFPAHDPVLIFAIVMTAVLTAPLLAEKLRLPGIVGLIFVGVFLGPHTTNILDRDKTIDLLGTIGLLYIMFQAGLEINLEEVRRNKHHSILFGLLTFIIPLTMGTAAGIYVLKLDLPASILLASMFSSHTLLTFPIISRMGLARKKSVTSAIGGTIITDTLAFLVLAVIIATHSGELDQFFWIKLISLSVIYTSAVIILLPRLTSWFFRYYLTDTGVEDYVFVLTAVFVSAYFSHLIGLEPIIGAFLAGLTLNPMIPEKSVLMGRIQFVGNSLFIPFFLISVGMLVNPFVLFTSTDAMIVSVVMIVVAFFSKDLAARLFSKLAGFDSTDRGIIFGMSVNQAAATLAAVMVGYRVGIFGSDILTGTIMMIIVTCFFGSVITQHYARKMALSSKKTAESETGSKLGRILIPISNEDNVKNLMDFAFLIHPKTSKEPLFPLHIALEREDVEKKIIEGEALLSKAAFKASSAQRTVIPLNRIDNNIPASILKTINEQRISQVIMGWHDSGLFARSFYETVSEKVAKSSDRMIIIPKIVQPLSITKRIILFIPSYLNRQDGFSETASSLKEIGRELSIEWIIVTDEKTYNDSEKYFRVIKKPQLIKIDNWRKVSEQLSGFVKPDDMIVILMARTYSFAWRPVFQRMPALLCSSYPENNFSLVYPFRRTDIPEEEEGFDNGEKCAASPEILKLVPESGFYFTEEDSDPLIILKKITDAHYSENGRHIFRALSDVVKDYPLELTDDIVLIHNRTDITDEYGVFIAVSKKGFNFSKLENTHNIIIVVISPEKESAQSHLNMLSRISRMVRSGNCIMNLKRSDSYTQFRQITEARPE